MCYYYERILNLIPNIHKEEKMDTPPVQYQYQQVPAPKKTNTMAIVGFILSFFFALVGAILGFIALGQIKNSNGAEGGKGLAVAAVIIGLLSTVTFIIVFFVLPVILATTYGDISSALSY